MSKRLGEQQVRITVRLPQALYDALMDRRLSHFPGSWAISARIRHAVEHTLRCPERQREEDNARQRSEEMLAAFAARRAARP